MATFKFNPKVDLDRADITDAALGAAAAAGFKTADIGKLVKLGIAHNYIPVTDGSDIEGFIVSVEPNTVNSGFCFGSVQRNGRVVVKNVAAGAQLAVGDFVSAATQSVAIGTAGKSDVKKVAAGATLEALNFRWRVISRMSGTGLAGEEVLIERI